MAGVFVVNEVMFHRTEKLLSESGTVLVQIYFKSLQQDQVVEAPTYSVHFCEFSWASCQGHWENNFSLLVFIVPTICVKHRWCLGLVCWLFIGDLCWMVRVAVQLAQGMGDASQDSVSVEPGSDALELKMPGIALNKNIYCRDLWIFESILFCSYIPWLLSILLPQCYCT